MWKVLTVERFDHWFLTLTEPEQVDVLAGIKLLEIKGPHLGRPYVDSLKNCRKVKNLKELRIQHRGMPYRVFFAFDPMLQAVLLCGGNKSNKKQFYSRMIAFSKADFLDYLTDITIEL